MNFGLPYMGSKNTIVPWVMHQLPAAEVFVDLFAGGCSVTHGAMLSGKYRRFLANDIGDAPQLFLDAIDGKYRNERRWISRERFQELKGSAPYVRYCWSFGNNAEGYLYSQEVEPWKKALHYARVYGDRSLLREFGIDSDGSRADIVKHEQAYKERYIKWWLSQQDYTAAELDALIEKCRGDIAVQEEELRQYLLRALRASGHTQADVQKRLGNQMAGHYFGRSQWQFPTREAYEQMRTFMPALAQDYDEVVGLTRLWQSLASLQRLQSLQSLESLQRLQSLEVTRKSYDEVELPADACIYCDPPYRGTNATYCEGFDFGKFDDFLRNVGQPIYVSEYTMPEDFVPIAERYKLKGADATGLAGYASEKIFLHEKWVKR